jgi:uncharacterized membrane protein
MVAALVLGTALVAVYTARVDAQQGSYVPDALFMALFANGDALVEYDVQFTSSLDEQVTVELFGETVSDLIVTDFDDQLLVFETNGNGQVTIMPEGAEGARTSYVTSSLTSKENSEWTFSIQSPVSVAIRMPQDSVVTDYGDNLPSLTTVGSQTLLTFDPGDIQFSYVIGVVGTQEQAEITIRFAQAAIRDARAAYQGIVLAGAETLLQNANAAMANENFAEAERLASQATEQVSITVSEYEDANAAIADADTQISQAAGQSRDTAQAAELLNRANGELAAGNYTSARATAGQAVAAIGDAPQFPTVAVIGGTAAAAGGAVAYFFLFKKKGAPRPAFRQQPDAQQAVQEPVLEEQEPEEEQEPAAPEPPAPTVSASQLAGIPESQTDKGLLARIVARIITEKPGLRPEDRDVLGFLAEKEGAAFESEVRTKFNLPKTTVWRLVKRLEREELVEIRKAGGQNLIKLRFEGRQP